MILNKLFDEFFESEKAAGIILVFVTILSMILANTGWPSGFINFWQIDLGGHTIVQWINDGLMTIFFLMIGLELERELYKGELSSLKNASLPIVAAIGGMLVPAGLFLLLNFGTNTQSGAGIPMATDIAFAIGILALIGKCVPNALKIFLLAIAIADDLGAIIMIAIFYTTSLAYTQLLLAIGILGILILLNRLRVYNLLPYIVGGIAMWYFMLHSGVHATISGVLLALAIPFGKGDKKSPSYKLQHYLHKPVAFVILPVFALANTCIPLGEGWWHSLGQASSLGIIVGLVLGKPLGIWLFSRIAFRLHICTLPPGLSWKNLLGAGSLAGIGFTMSIFIAHLAFTDTAIINNAKIAILLASLLAGILGYFFLKHSLKKNEKNPKTT